MSARAIAARAAGASAAAVLLGASPAVRSGAAAGGGMPAAPAGATPVAGAFMLTGAQVAPRRAYFAGRPVSIGFALDAPAALDLRVDIVREATGRPVKAFRLAAVAPGARPAVEWDGLTASHEVAPNGSYRARVGAPGASARNAGRFELRSHIYPIRGPHADRGPIGQFGVARSGGRTHEGYDVNAACGTPLVAARGGVVTRADYDPVLYGNLVIIRGERTRRDYWYAHLLRSPRLHAGERVRTGQRIGSVGATGNARTIGCHLHFEIHARGKPIDPRPQLHAWDGWS